MLQQTGVDRVAATWPRFLERFPSFEALAAAPRQEVLRAWAGLGYNRRAVHLHELAKAVVERHGGRLPSDPAALRALPGVGPYTQGAIESLIFGRDVAALDTNVRRVVDRISLGGVGSEKQIAAAAAELVPAGRSADWNQALMDFGSLQCVAISPACLLCPVADLCAAAPVPPGRRPRQVAEPTERFEGSRRYFRGRIVAVLRDMPPDGRVSLPDLTSRITPSSEIPDPARLESLVRALAKDGLARLESTERGIIVGPP